MESQDQWGEKNHIFRNKLMGRLRLYLPEVHFICEKGMQSLCMPGLPKVCMIFILVYKIDKSFRYISITTFCSLY